MLSKHRQNEEIKAISASAIVIEYLCRFEHEKSFNKDVPSIIEIVHATLYFNWSKATWCQAKAFARSLSTCRDSETLGLELVDGPVTSHIAQTNEKFITKQVLKFLFNVAWTTSPKIEWYHGALNEKTFYAQRSSCRNHWHCCTREIAIVSFHLSLCSPRNLSHPILRKLRRVDWKRFGQRRL